MVKKSQGLGDDIKRVTDKLGISSAVKTIFGDSCGCSERQSLLNSMFPHFKNIRAFTKDEKQIYERVMPQIEKTKKVTRENQQILSPIYQAVFNMKAKWSNCGKCTKRTLDNLKKVYEKSCEI
jgi:hypothetical protein|tara:strand:+ start:1034 stop:1402 length:369 start_codon:yes stop_codon:yes gene_type:complete